MVKAKNTRITTKQHHYGDSCNDACECEYGGGQTKPAEKIHTNTSIAKMLTTTKTNATKKNILRMLRILHLRIQRLHRFRVRLLLVYLRIRLLRRLHLLIYILRIRLRHRIRPHHHRIRIHIILRVRTLHCRRFRSRLCRCIIRLLIFVPLPFSYT